MGLTRMASTAAVFRSGVRTSQVLGKGPCQGEGPSTFLTFQQLGMGHTRGTCALTQLCPQGLVAHNIGESHLSKVLRIVRWQSTEGCARVRTIPTQRSGSEGPASSWLPHGFQARRSAATIPKRSMLPRPENPAAGPLASCPWPRDHNPLPVWARHNGRSCSNGHGGGLGPIPTAQTSGGCGQAAARFAPGCCQASS